MGNKKEKWKTHKKLKIIINQNQNTLKTLSAFHFLISFIGIYTINAQTPNPEFQKTVDSLNFIIKENHLAYYINNKKHGEFIIKISATEQGVVSFTDSIPKSEMTGKKPDLVSDCCPQKNSRKLDLFDIENWEYAYPYLNIKSKNNEVYARFIGFKKLDLEKLKEQFEKLKTLCKKEIINN